MSTQNSGKAPLRGNDEDNEAIRLYKANDHWIEPLDDESDYTGYQPNFSSIHKYEEDLTASPEASGYSALSLQGSYWRSTTKRNGNIYGSDDESPRLGIETAQKRNERLEGDRREALNQRVKDENALRNKLGNTLLVTVILQLAVSDIFLFLFLRANPHNQTVMTTWLGTSVVEIVGIIWVITRSLFPFQDRYRDREAEDLARPRMVSQVSELKSSQTVEKEA